jgi:uncharacterized protein involved in outer membrane biogenesis
MRWKRILLIFALIIVVLIVAVYVILSRYDFNEFKPQIAQAVMEATGRELTMEGDIKIKLGFAPGLSIENVSFQNAPWGSRPELAKIKRFETQVALLPLIKGIIEIKRFILIAPDIFLETNKSGKLNLDFQTAETPNKQKSKPPAIFFNEVRIENGRLRYKDGQSDQIYRLNLYRLTAESQGKGEPIEVSLKSAYNDKMFDVDGTLGALDLMINPNELWPVELTAKAASTNCTVQGVIKDLFNGKGLDLTVLGRGQSIHNVVEFFEIQSVPDFGPFEMTARVTGSFERLTVEQLDFQAGNEALAKVRIKGTFRDLLALKGIELSFKAEGKNVANLEKFTGQPLPLEGLFSVSGRFIDPAPEAYKFSDLKVILVGNHFNGWINFNLTGQQPQMTAALSSDKLNLRPMSILHDSAARDIPDLGPCQLAVQIADPFDKLSVQNFDLQIGSEKLAEVRINGFIKEPLNQRGIDVSFTLRGKDFANLEKIAGQSFPIQGPYLASGRFSDPEVNVYKISNLKVVAGENDMRGRIDLNLKRQRPKVTAALASRKLNLTSIFSKTEGKTPTAKEVKKSESKQDVRSDVAAPSSLEMLTAVDANIKIQFKKILLTQLTLNDLSAGITLEGGKLTMKAEGPALPDITEFAGIPGLPDLGPYKLMSKATVFSDKLTLEKLAFNMGSEKLAEVSIRCKIESLLELRGIELRFATRGKDVVKLEKFIGHPLPIEGAFAASGRFTDSSKKIYTLDDFKVVIGDNDITGSIDLILSGQRPQIKSVLSSDKLDLRPLFPTIDKNGLLAEQTSESRIKKEKVIHEEPFSLEFLEVADANLNMRAQHIMLPALAINNLAVDIILQEGHFTAFVECRSIPDIAELTGVNRLQDMGPGKLVTSGTASAGKLIVEKLDFHAGTEEIVDLTLSGSAKNLLTWQGIEFSFMIRGKDVANLERFAGRPLPINGPFSASGRLTDPKSNIYTFKDFKIIMGDNDLGGWAELNLTGQRPRVTAEILSQKLDLRQLSSITDTEETTNGPSAKPGIKQDKVFPNDSLRLDALKFADANIIIRAGTIIYKHLELYDCAFDILLKDGHLTAKGLEFSSGGGSVTSRFDLRPIRQDAAIAMDLKIKQIHLGPALKELDVSQAYEGTLDAEIEINGQGDSVAALMASLDGTITLVHRGGRIANRYLGLIGGGIANELVKRINPFSQKQAYTEINCFVTHFDINEGLAGHVGVLDTPQTTLMSAGKINLKAETLNLSFNTSPKKGIKIPGIGRVSFSLSELTKPFNVSGTLANPSLVVDPKKTAVTFGKVVGGLALGPAGLAVLFGDVSSKDVNPCLQAINALEGEE